MYVELPEALLADGDELDVDGEPLGPVDDVPLDVVAFDSMNDGPNWLVALVEREVPVVAVERLVPLPDVPTVPACSLGMMQPTNVTCCC